MKKLWGWLLKLWRHLLKLFGIGREIPRAERRRKDRLIGRYIITSRGGPNMPKKQRCPLHHGWRKRVVKTLGGAKYLCNTCNSEFFVPLSRYWRGYG